ncbi:SOS response-associated peptidase [Acinetobacter sp. ANC 4648]|uniref:SOS response-associated peptidase n=1 Tax=Acinetobacter sp. ANC 4648 TaxID=1977875 RepID=UPI000A3343EF|nr:SOS response-associated peptidase family protein [Acinetobacter sp. ANC 4648]OTG82198.1 DUF159 family protein [Acinetobacter sp. ANC 4648]
MCSNYHFPSKKRLSLLDLHESKINLDFESHVYPLNPAPIIMRGADQFELDIAKFGLIPHWAKELKLGRHTYNARTETVASKPSFKHAWQNNKFCLVPVDMFYEPKYIDGKPYWYAISKADGNSFTAAAIYEDAIINGKPIRSFSMLTINADHHPFMKQFHEPKNEKRSIIVIPEEYRKDWLSTTHEKAHHFFFEMSNEFVAAPKSLLSEIRDSF